MNVKACILALLVSAVVCFGQAFGLNDPAFMGQQQPAAAGGGGSCAVSSILDDTDNDGTTTGAGVLSQSITVGSTITVCKVRVRGIALGNDSTVTMSFRTAPNGGGSLVGTASQTASITSSGGVHVWVDLTWASNPTLAAGTYYLTLTEGTFEVEWAQESGNNGLGYTGGDAYTGATANTFRDFTFEVWTQ